MKKIFDNFLLKSAIFVSLTKWVDAINTAVTSVFRLNESMSKEIENQKSEIKSLTKVCEILLKAVQNQQVAMDNIIQAYEILVKKESDLSPSQSSFNKLEKKKDIN